MKWLKEKIAKKEMVNLDDFILNCPSYSLLKKLVETNQDPIWHAEGNVYIHVNMCFKEIYKIFNSVSFTNHEKYLLLMSIAFHDIYKPLTTIEAERNGRVCVIAPKHEYKGMSYLYYKFLDEVDITFEDRNAILDLVGYHQEPKMFVIKNKNEWDYRNLTKNVSGKLYYYLELSDMLGRVCEDVEKQIEILDVFKMFCEEYGVYETNNTFESSLNNYFNEDSDIAQNYLIGKAKRDLLLGNIINPLECIGKYYDHKLEHSNFYMLCGISGSGKSTVVSDLLNKNIVNEVVSLDAIRKTIKSSDHKYINGQTRQISKEMIKKLLNKKVNFVLDSTNYLKDYRDPILTLSDNYNALSHRVLLDIPVEECIKRDQDRVDYVGKKIILNQMERFEYPENKEFNFLYK